MAPLPAPRPLPLAEGTSLSPPPPPSPPGPPFRRPGLQAERINRPRLFGGHPRGPAPPSPRDHGSEEQEAAAGRRTHGLGNTDGGAGNREARGGAAGPQQVKRASECSGRPGPADFYLLPGAGRSADRTRAEAQTQSPVLPPLGAERRTREARGSGCGAPQAPRPDAPGTFVPAGARRSGSALQWGGGSRGRVLGSGVENGASRRARPRRAGPRSSRPAGPRRRRKGPIVRREIHFWGPSESSSFF